MAEAGGQIGFRLVTGVLLVVIVSCWQIPALPATAAETADPGPPVAPEKRSARGKLRLTAKDPATWRIIRGGAHGTLLYNVESGAFSLVAEKLRANTGYALVRHTPGSASGDLLADGTAGPSGRLALTGVWNEWKGKFWLVPSADITVTGKVVSLKKWRPRQILFEEKVLGIPCECDDQ